MKKENSPYFRKFGFELEFSTPINDVEKIAKNIINKICGKAKLVTDSNFLIKNTNYNKWELKSDGSTECELTTPISKIKDFNKIKKITEKLKENKVKQTTKDSVHVHMQADDVPKHNIIAAWIQIENEIIKCFPKHRRHNTYCQKLIPYNKKRKIADFFIQAEEESMQHHSIVSLNYYDDRKTVEFRIMEGNIEINNIMPWVKFCMLFLNYAKSIDPIEIICRPKNKLKINDIITELNINDDAIVDFLQRRIKRFK